MDINDETIDKLCDLAKLEFKGEERAAIKQDLSRILSYFEKLNQIDTNGVEPLIFMTDAQNILREDKPAAAIQREEALKNAPAKDSDYFRVPKVLDK